jgi:hypothetical protein
MKTVLQYFRRFQTTDPIIYMKKTCRRCDEEEGDESDAVLEEDLHFDLHGNEACLRHHHELQQSCCILIFISQVIHELYDTKQEGRVNICELLPFMWCVMEKWTTHFFLFVKLGFFSVDM